VSCAINSLQYHIHLSLMFGKYTGGLICHFFQTLRKLCS
jgi:hypothetical protein